jgi:hypothetical protein
MPASRSSKTDSKTDSKLTRSLPEQGGAKLTEAPAADPRGPFAAPQRVGYMMRSWYRASVSPGFS